LQVKKEASPGIPYAAMYNAATNLQIQERAVAQADIWSEVFNRMLALGARERVPRGKSGLLEFRQLDASAYADAVQRRLVDPIRLFIKDEPHTLKKVSDKRWRMIASVSLVDQVIQRILHTTLNDAEKSHVATQPHCIGLGHTDPHIATLKAKFLRAMKPTVPGAVVTCFATDVTNFDFSLRPEHFAVDQEYRRLAQRYATGDWWTNVAASFEELLLNGRFMAGDGTLLVPPFGVQKSGSFCTSSSNSHIRAFVGFMGGAKASIVMGDDALEFLEHHQATPTSTPSRVSGPPDPAGTVINYPDEDEFSSAGWCTQLELHGIRVKRDEITNASSGSVVPFIGVDFDFTQEPTRFLSNKPGKSVFKAIAALSSESDKAKRHAYLNSWQGSWNENYRYLSQWNHVEEEVRSQLANVVTNLRSLADGEQSAKLPSPTVSPSEPSTTHVPSDVPSQEDVLLVQPQVAPVECALPPAPRPESGSVGLECPSGRSSEIYELTKCVRDLQRELSDLRHAHQGFEIDSDPESPAAPPRVDCASLTALLADVLRHNGELQRSQSRSRDRSRKRGAPHGKHGVQPGGGGAQSGAHPAATGAATKEAGKPPKQARSVKEAPGTGKASA